MNIEEEIQKILIKIRTGKEVTVGDDTIIETLLTAYEKEKGENIKLRLQDIPLIEGELKAYKDRVNELKIELEKEKEKNKILLQCLKDSQERCENEHLFLGNPDM